MQSVELPTSKQIAYIRQLSRKLGYLPKVKDTPLTKKQAAEMINRLLEQEGNEASVRNDSPDRFAQ